MDKGFIINKRAQPEASAGVQSRERESRLDVVRALCREGRTARDRTEKTEAGAENSEHSENSKGCKEVAAGSLCTRRVKCVKDQPRRNSYIPG